VSGGRRAALPALAGLSLSLAAVSSAGAQTTGDARLARLDAVTRHAVRAIVDSAHATKLPTEPLVDKALEGARRGADGGRIVGAVRALAADLSAARLALGPDAAAAEITSGAHALHAGFQAGDLTRLRAASRQGGRPGRGVTLPLAIATDLVARSVPPPRALGIVLSLTRAGVHDAELTAFQRNVRLDIERGADPSSAAETRARGALLRSGRSS